jgi:hypothetical protein
MPHHCLHWGMPMIENLSKWVMQQLGKLPSHLPRTKEELEHYSTNLLDLYNLPQDRLYHHAICETVMRMGPTATSAPKFYFAASVIKRMANAAAFERMKDFREQEKLEETQQKESLPDGQGTVQATPDEVVQQT